MSFTEIHEANQQMIEGFGNFKFDQFEYNLHFLIIYKPFGIIIRTNHVRGAQFFSFGNGQLEGQLNDGTIIKCDEIVMTGYSKNKLIFSVLKDLVFGEESNNNIRFKAKLIGAYIGSLKFNLNDYAITLEEPKNVQEVLDFCTDYGYIAEGSELVIEHINGNNINNQDFLKICKEFCVILSFISGVTVTFNRYSFESKEGIYNVWKVLLVQSNKGKGVISLHNLNEFLPTLIVNYHNLSAVRKKCLDTVIGYLNSTSLKYLEDCILNVAQAWEILALDFSEEKVELTEDIKVLKQLLKLTIKQWKAERNIDYDTGIISNRILGSLNWDAVIKKIENLATDEKLNFETLKLDIKGLIEIRNNIAHTGRFKEIGREYEYLEIFYSSLFSLQILILSKLGYDGAVFESIGGLRSHKNIKYFLHE